MHYSPLRNNFALIPGLEVLPPVPVLETRIPETRPSSVVLETKICFAFITRYPLIEFFFQIILELVHMQTSLQISDGEGMGSIFSEVNDDDDDDGDDGDDVDDDDEDDDDDDDDDYYDDDDDDDDSDDVDVDDDDDVDDGDDGDDVDDDDDCDDDDDNYSDNDDGNDDNNDGGDDDNNDNDRFVLRRF
jgi:hypothetical protein